MNPTNPCPNPLADPSAQAHPPETSPARRRMRMAWASVGLAALLTACGGGGGGDDGTQPPPPPPPGSTRTQAQAAFDADISTYASWSQLMPPAADSDGPTAGSPPVTQDELVGTKFYTCTVQDYSLTSSPREFVAISPDLRVTWPGALVQGRSHLDEGPLVPLVIDERAPLEISIDLLRQDNLRVVDLPGQGTVGSAIGDLVDRAAQAGHRAPADAVYEMSDAYSASQSALKLGLSVEYLGAAVESKLDVDKTAEEHTVTAYFMQRAYTVTARTPARPSDVLGANFPMSRMDELRGEGMSSDNPPLYVSSVTYGRVLMYKMTAKASSTEVRAAIEGSYSNATGSVNGVAESRWKSVLSSSRIDVAAYGGEESQILALIRSGKLRDYFSSDTSLTAMRPVSFTLTRLADNQQAGIVRNTNYKVSNCVYSRDDVSQAIGTRYNFRLLSVKVPYDCDAGIDPGDMFGSFQVLNTDAAGNNTSATVFSIGSSNTRSVSSGNTYDLNDNLNAVVRYHGRRFKLSGSFIDQDGGLNGANDTIGNWSLDLPTSAGTYSRTGSGNCGGNNATLKFELVFDRYIYP